VNGHDGVVVGELHAVGREVNEPLDHHRSLLRVGGEHDLCRDPIASLGTITQR
jgi:hypothetical protein